MSKNTNQAKMGVLFALSLTHLLNDLFQSVVTASYPVIRDNLGLTFSQIGLITLVYQICSSVFQPVFGVAFDRKPNARYLNIGTLATLTGLAILAYSTDISMVIVAVAFVGLGSSIIHPEASKLTHYASGGKHGLAQSIFQVGGNFGTSIGPLLAAWIIAPYGQRYMVVFAGMAFLALFSKRAISKWYRESMEERLGRRNGAQTGLHRVRLSKHKIYISLGILLVLIFSKYVYLASFSSYYTFYLIEKFGVTTQHSQLFLFAYLFAAAVGTVLGGPIGDRVGRKWVIWFSILGTAPFALMLPHANLLWTCVLSVVIGLVLSSAFSAILVYAQELLPRHVGLISGLFFGLAFGIAGIAAAVMGGLADSHGVEYVYRLSAYMPLLGIAAIFLPSVRPMHRVG
jgi:FSR family fosmidomycin resistance protein-like MFS transporter